MGQKVAKLTLLEIDYLPKMKGEYLTENDLWDSNWLKEKYPGRFIDDYFYDDNMLNDLDNQMRLMYGEESKSNN
tara:strand:+ start:172 stop:393 length:222 start_codon:yes stop_codon:yes gene_type:complete